jgi:hypothetical protein
MNTCNCHAIAVSHTTKCRERDAFANHRPSRPNPPCCTGDGVRQHCDCLQRLDEPSGIIRRRDRRGERQRTRPAPSTRTLASPIVFKVTNAADNPVAGVTVAFSISSGVGNTLANDRRYRRQRHRFYTVDARQRSRRCRSHGNGARRRDRRPCHGDATQIASTDCSAAATTLTLGQAITGLTGASLCVGGGTSGGDFALVPFNTSLDGASRAALTVQATGAGATAVASLTPAAGSFNLLGGASTQTSPLSSLALTRALDARLRASEARELAPLIPGARAWMAARQRTASGAVPGLSLSVIPSTATVGQLVTLNANAESACSSPVMRTGRVAAAVGSKAIIVADTANPVSGYTDADYQSIASTFDTVVDPTDTKAFGAPSDIDGNGHVVLFFTRAVNELTPARSTSYVAGFFYARDLFPATANASFQACASSNGGEMFYLMVPDPTGVVNGNKFREGQRHEHRHRHAGARIPTPDQRVAPHVREHGRDRLRGDWLDEGLSHVAEELLFYARSGLKPRANIDATKLRSSSVYVDAFNNDAVSNFARLGEYLRAPSSNSPFADNDSLATRGATWSFLRYAADHTGSDDGTTWFQLVNSTTTGLANLTQVFGSSLTTLARDWATSVFTDDITTTDARYQEPSWNMRSIFGALQSNGAYPIATTTLGSTPAALTVTGGSAAYLRFSVAAGSAATIQWSAVPSTVQFTLVRTR